MDVPNCSRCFKLFQSTRLWRRMDSLDIPAIPVAASWNICKKKSKKKKTSLLKPNEHVNTYVTNCNIESNICAFF